MRKLTDGEYQSFLKDNNDLATACVALKRIMRAPDASGFTLSVIAEKTLQAIQVTQDCPGLQQAQKTNSVDAALTIQPDDTGGMAEGVRCDTGVNDARPSASVPSVSSKDNAVAEARKALHCLYLAAEASVAEDVGKKVEAAFAQLSEPHCCRCSPIQHCTACPIPASTTQTDNYPCRECGAPRTKDQGGTTFTVCDACWDKAYPGAVAPADHQVKLLEHQNDVLHRWNHEARAALEDIFQNSEDNWAAARAERGLGRGKVAEHQASQARPVTSAGDKDDS